MLHGRRESPKIGGGRQMGIDLLVVLVSFRRERGMKRYFEV